MGNDLNAVFGPLKLNFFEGIKADFIVNIACCCKRQGLVVIGDGDILISLCDRESSFITS